MKSSSLKGMKKGWFVGNFLPTAYKTEEVEAAVKKYKKGDKEGEHYHKIATEITLVHKGKVKMFDREWQEGDIVIVEPGDSTAFEALDDAVTFVLKIPGATKDKYSPKGELLC